MALRLAMFTDNFFPELGGIQDSILATARALGERGHRLRVYAPAPAARDFELAGFPVAEPDLGPNVSVCRLPAVAVPSSSQQSRLAFPSPAYWRDVARFAPDVVHVHTFLGVGLAGRHAARRLHRPLVGTNHWFVESFSVYVPLARTLFRQVSSKAVARFYRACERVSAPSRFTLDALCDSGLKQPVSVISNPIDTECFHPVPAHKRCSVRARLRLHGPTVVYAGRLGREKHVEVVIEAVARARTRIPGLQLVIAGHGSARPELEAQARAMGLHDAVRFVGTLDHRALAELFAAADLFAIASTSETQSMVLLQAMACGLPAVGVRAGGLAEHVAPGTGLLAQPHSAAHFAEQVLAVLDSEARQRAMGEAARRFAARFSLPRITDAWEAFYADAVHAPLAGAGARAGRLAR